MRSGILLAAVLAFWSALSAADTNSVLIPIMAGLTGDSAQFGKGELDAVRRAAEGGNARGGINGARSSRKPGHVQQWTLGPE